MSFEETNNTLVVVNLDQLEAMLTRTVKKVMIESMPKEVVDPNDIVTSKEAGKRLGYSKSKVDQLKAGGDIGSKNINGVRRIREIDLTAYLEKRRQND